MRVVNEEVLAEIDVVLIPLSEMSDFSGVSLRPPEGDPAGAAAGLSPLDPAVAAGGGQAPGDPESVAVDVGG